MPTNKNALIRYQALDRCLGNWQRRFYIEDLVDACNEALYSYNDDTKDGCGVKKRQVQEDLKFMESDEGYGMMIDAIADGRRKYYRYHHRDASINDRPINQEEVELIANALALLQRFEGIPQFSWLDDLAKRLDATSRLGRNADTIVSFEHNPYLRGMDKWYRPVFEAIVSRHAIEITYRPFGKEARTLTVSPYHLRQYNNRWFLIAKRTDYAMLSNFAIDRIESIRESSHHYEPLPQGYDFRDMYSDIVGISDTSGEVMDVALHIADKAIAYVMTKPLHESQSSKPIKLPDGSWKLTLRVKDNYELRSLLRSFGSEIEVVSPESLRQAMIDEAKAVERLYKV